MANTNIGMSASPSTFTWAPYAGYTVTLTNTQANPAWTDATQYNCSGNGNARITGAVSANHPTSIVVGFACGDTDPGTGSTLLTFNCSDGSTCQVILYGSQYVSPASPTPTPTPTPTVERKVFLNLNDTQDYVPSGTFADMMTGARPFTAGPTTVQTDTNGAPLGDFFTVVLSGFGRETTSGTSTLWVHGQFTGLSFPNCAAQPVAGTPTYNSSTNVTTVSIQIPPSTSDDVLTILLQGTKRNPTDNPGTGVLGIKWMRPIAQGSTTAHPITETFSRLALQDYARFDGIRFLNWIGTNDYGYTIGSVTPPQSYVTLSVSQRRLPTAILQNASTPAPDVAWEYMFALCNTVATISGRSCECYVPVPDLADDSWVTGLCNAARWGTDGVNPHTGPAGTATTSNPNPQPSGGPIYAPLQGRLILEWSNEVCFNFGFPQWQRNINFATGRVTGYPATSSDLNYDGTTDQFLLGIRRICQQATRVRNLAEAVFPGGKGVKYAISLMGFQQNIAYLQDYIAYFSHLQSVTGHPMSYYIDYGGCAFYEHTYASNPNANYNVDPSDSTVQIVNSGLRPMDAIVQSSQLLQPLGIGVLEYEGLNNVAEGTYDPQVVACNADPGFGRLCRESMDRQFRVANVNICSVYMDTGGSWGLNNFPGENTPRFEAVVAARDAWAANPTAGTSTDPMPPVSTLTAIQLSAPAITATTTVVQVSASFTGTNSPITTGVWTCTLGTIDQTGLLTLPSLKSLPQTVQVKFTASLSIYNGVNGTINLVVPASTSPAPPPVPDGSFEAIMVPSSPPFTMNPTSGSPWTFAGGSGVGLNVEGGYAHNENLPLPAGAGINYAILQNLSSVTQSIPGWVDGTFTVSFGACLRDYLVNVQSVTVKIDGVVIATIPITTTSWANYTTPSFPVTPGAHTLALAGTNGTGDNSALVDQVAVNLVSSAVVPVTPTPTPTPVVIPTPTPTPTPVTGNTWITIDDAASTTLALAHSSGSTSLVLKDASAFNPTTSSPRIVTVIRAKDGARCHYLVTAKVGNVLAGTPTDGYTDLSCNVGDKVLQSFNTERLAEVRSAIDANTASIGVVTTNLATLSSTVTTVQATLGTAQTAATALTSTVATVQASVTSAQAAIATNTTATSTLQTTVAGHTTSIAANANNITTLSGQVASNNTAIQANTTSIATKATDTAVVHLAGTESISGAKSFSGGLTSTTPASTDSSTTVATTAFVQAQPLLKIGGPVANGGAAGEILYVDPSGNLGQSGNLSFNNNVLNMKLNASASTTPKFLQVTSLYGVGLMSMYAYSSGGVWIDLPTIGPSGIGTGGPGANPWIAYCQGAGNWFSDAAAGDTAYRNGLGSLRFGIDGAMSCMTIATGTGTVQVNQHTANNPAAVFKLVANATSDLVQHQTSSGSVVSGVEKSGLLYTGSSTTATRPTTATVGAQWFDTSLSKPIWWAGSKWVDATGTAV